MKTRVSVSLILVFAALVFSAACRGREQSSAPAATATPHVPSSGQPSPPAQILPAPTNCQATQIDTNTIRVEWQFAGQAAGFRIYQGKTSLEATVGTSARSWSISNLPPGVQHHFDVRAFNASGESRVDACNVDTTRR
jgi:hypothetical protein